MSSGSVVSNGRWAICAAAYGVSLALFGCGNGTSNGGENSPIGQSGGAGAGSGGATGAAIGGTSATTSPGGSNAGTASTSPGSGGAVTGSGGAQIGGGGTAPMGGGGGQPSSGGTSSVMTTMAGGAAGSGSGGAGTGGTTSYPMLTASQVGMPKQVAQGYTLAESPLWDPCGHQLLFVDVKGGGGQGVINALGADGKVSVFMSGTGNANGLAWAPDGSLMMAQMGTKHIARRDKSGMVTDVTPSGPPLHTPDDLVVRSDGTVYFTDGDFCPVGNTLGAASQLPVYFFKPGAAMLTSAGNVSGPNGIELSPDEKLLYVNGYGDNNVYRYSVAADGSLTKDARPFMTGLTRPDSMCLDAAGNIYVAVGTGLLIARPDGSMITQIPITSVGTTCVIGGVTNCTFGGDDGKTLYITNWTSVFKVEGMPIPGLDWVVGKQRVKCN